MGAELARKRAGEKTQTGMSENQLEDFARGGDTNFKQKYAQRRRRLKERANG